METKVIESKLKSFNNEVLPESGIKVNAKFYDGTGSFFTLSVDDKINGRFYLLAKMFAAHLASLKLHPNTDCPIITEDAIKGIKPIAIEFFKELCRHDYSTGEEHGEKLLELWTNQAFQLMQSGHGIP